MRVYLRRLVFKPYGRTLLTFVVLQIVFLALAGFFRDIFHGRSIDDIQMAFVVICAYAFVSLNTRIFSDDLNGILTAMPRLSNAAEADNVVAEQRNALHMLDFSKYLTGAVVLTVLLYLFLPIETVEREWWWQRVLMLNEWLSVCIFSIFVYVDVSCLKISQRYLNDILIVEADRAKIECFRNNIKTFLLASDGPGLFGLVIIAGSSWALHDFLNPKYWQGFVIGAMGLHIAFSQTSLAFLDAGAD